MYFLATRTGTWAGGRRFAAIIVAGATLAACTVPEHMTVDKGGDPRNADENVRFRTTYYFRVFDYCGNRAETATGMPDSNQILVDSLYRFRMTGKANALATQVKFESGTLKKWQIDPFGAAVVFDEDTRQFRFQSQEETAAQHRQQLATKRIDKLVALRDRLVRSNCAAGARVKIDAQIGNAVDLFGPGTSAAASTGGEGGSGTKATGAIHFKGQPAPGASVTLNGVKFTFKTVTSGPNDILIGTDVPATLKNLVKGLKKSKDERVKLAAYDQDGIASLTVTYAKPGRAGNAFALAVADASGGTKSNMRVSGLGKSLSGGGDVEPCSAGSVVRRGFQVLGPQGLATFNQDDRLILAMSTSAKPLISTLSQLSSRLLEEGPTRTEALLPLVEERLRITEARSLADVDDFDDAKVGAIIETLNTGG